MREFGYGLLYIFVRFNDFLNRHSRILFSVMISLIVFVFALFICQPVIAVLIAGVAGLIIFLFPPYKRLSDVVIYNRLSHEINMCFSKSDLFSEYDYASQKSEVSEKFKELFIIGIINSNKRTLNAKTHKWMVKNVFLDPRVTAIYDVVPTETGTGNMAMEVLLLSHGQTENIHPRTKYHVELTKRKSG